MNYTEDRIHDANSFCEFYVDLMHNFNDRVKYFLADDVVLDYFGHTIKGQKNVSNYIKSNILTVKHHFNKAVPVDTIGFRDTHVVKLPKEPKRPVTPLFSPQRTTHARTPIKPIGESSNSSFHPAARNIREEIGQGDGPHNNEISFSPAKKLRLSGDNQTDELNNSIDFVEDEPDDSEQIKYILAEGSVEFHRPSIKKLQTETKWKRPCKLSVAYTSTTSQDCTIYLIIYEGNVKCRKNLLKDFEALEDIRD